MSSMMSEGPEAFACLSTSSSWGVYAPGLYSARKWLIARLSTGWSARMSPPHRVPAAGETPSRTPRRSRPARPAPRSAQVVALDLPVERAQPDPEQRSRARLVAARVPQRGRDQMLFRLLDRHPHAHGER